MTSVRRSPFAVVRRVGRDGHRPSAIRHRTLLMATVLIAAMAAPIAHACPVCFGDPNSPMAKSTSNGILFLLGIVGFVQIGFVALFFSFWRRARALKKFREQFHVVKGGAI